MTSKLPPMQDEWLPVGDATAVAKCSERTLKRRVDDGYIRARKGKADEGRVWLYHAADCRKFAERAEEQEELSMGGMLTELRKVFELMRQPMEIFVKAIADENAALRQREKEHHETYLTYVAAREGILSEQTIRDLEAIKVEKAEDRKTQGMALAVNMAKQLMGKSPEARLLQSVTEQQLAMLAKIPGVLTPDQQALVVQVIQSRRAVADMTNGVSDKSHDAAESGAAA